MVKCVRSKKCNQGNANSKHMWHMLRNKSAQESSSDDPNKVYLNIINDFPSKIN